MSKWLAHMPEYGDVKFSVDSLPLSNKFIMNNTPGIKKPIIIVFVFDGCRLIFFDDEQPIDRHLALCRFI
jgi:hypothetical protein